jgi:hypothetical protein
MKILVHRSDVELLGAHSDDTNHLDLSNMVAFVIDPFIAIWIGRITLGDNLDGDVSGEWTAR